MFTSKDDSLKIRKEGFYCKFETPSAVEPGRDSEDRTIEMVKEREDVKGTCQACRLPSTHT